MRVIVATLAAFLLTPLHAQNPSAKKTAVQKAATQHAKPAKPRSSTSAKEPSLAPLTDRERAVQFLNRFTFGPRPVEVEHVLALNTDQWFEQQLDPAARNDDVLN